MVGGISLIWAIPTEAAGIDNIAISVTDSQGARDLIQDFGREVISKRA